VKTFLLIAMLSIGSGLAVRFAFHHHKTETPPPPPPPVVEVTRPPDPVPVAPPPPPVAPVPEPPPPPPRIAGSKQISDAAVREFATAPGVVYYCDNKSVMAQPKSGGSPQIVGDCEQAFDFVADAEGVFYCDQHRLLRITAGTQGSHVVVAETECIMSALDSKFAYFIVPGFEGVDNPGVYRVARAGGTPEKIHTTRPKEQFILTNDGDSLWIAAFFAGTISKLAKTPNATARPVVTDQKSIVTIAVDATYVYWHPQTSKEIRRRKKTGGPIEVVGHDVDQDQTLAVDGHVYWFEGADTERLVHLAPGAAKPETLASGLHSPTLRVDSEGAYVTELDRDGIFMFAR
jgi:hypothetical protein